MTTRMPKGWRTGHQGDGKTILVSIPESDRGEKAMTTTTYEDHISRDDDDAVQAILERWPQIRAALDVIGNDDADMFSPDYTRAVRAIRMMLPALPPGGP